MDYKTKEYEANHFIKAFDKVKIAYCKLWSLIGKAQLHLILLPNPLEK